MIFVTNTSSDIGSQTINTLGIVTTGTWEADILGFPYGGTNAALTASLGSLVYSTASSLAFTSPPVVNHQIAMGIVGGAPIWSDIIYPNSILPGQLLYGNGTTTISGLATATNGVLVTNASNIPSILAGSGVSNQLLMSSAAASPFWSTATYPSTTTVNQILYSSSTNTLAGLSTANSSTLMTNASGVPAWQTTSSNFVTSITGTANQIIASASTDAITLSLPSAVVISSSINVANIKLIGNSIQVTGNLNITPSGSSYTSFSSSVGISGATPNSPLQFSSSTNNRILTLFEVTNNPFQYYGFGILPNTLVYNVAAVTNIHAFYAGTSSSASKELMRITATGTTSNSGCIGINVGGTPLAACHVIGGVQNVSGEDTCFRAQSASNSAKIELDSTSGSGRLYELRSTNSGTLDVVDRTGSVEKIIINTLGFGFGASAAAPSYDGDCNGTFRSKRLLGNGNAPTFSVLSGAGTGATASISGCELSGKFSLTLGTLPAGGDVVTFTLSSAMPDLNYAPLFVPSNQVTTQSTPWVRILSTTQFNITFPLSILSGGSICTWHYTIIGST